jgi:hypothetical protein
MTLTPPSKAMSTTTDDWLLAAVSYNHATCAISCRGSRAFIGVHRRSRPGFSDVSCRLLQRSNNSLCIVLAQLLHIPEALKYRLSDIFGHLSGRSIGAPCQCTINSVVCIWSTHTPRHTALRVGCAEYRPTHVGALRCGPAHTPFALDHAKMQRACAVLRHRYTAAIRVHKGSPSLPCDIQRRTRSYQ